DPATPEYWVRQVREPVRFADALTTSGRTPVFLELGPEGTLSALAQGVTDDAVAVPALRTGREETGTLLRALAALHVHGVPVDWAGQAHQWGGRRVDLPTYAFARERYWPSASGHPGDVVFAGLGDTGHPLLAAGVELADDGGLLFTARLSARTHPWLTEHRVHGRTVVPGTAFVELAVRAGDQAGCGVVDELVLHAPLVLPEQHATQLQVLVGVPDPDGRRDIVVHSRTADDTGWSERPWTRHASGTLRAAGPDVAPDLSWPPPGAEPVEVDGLYPALAGAGLEYGPAFRGVRAAWRAGDDVWAEVELPDSAHADAARFGLHPALLDAALHALAARATDGPAQPPALPFSWSGVTLAASGATALRVRLSPRGADGVTLLATDPGGRTVVRVEHVVLRPLAVSQFDGPADGTRPVYRLDWLPATGVAPDHGVPSGTWAVVGHDPFGAAAGLAALGADCVRVADVASAPSGFVLVTSAPSSAAPTGPAEDEETDARVTAVLTAVQEFLARDDTDATLVVLTRGAVSAEPGDDLPDPSGAAVWGLLRSVQSENPERILLVDGDADPWAALLRAP
ncbi:polyketide synthase dehydratase domain-containing protein, partial [Streptomyces sp. ACA25]|uniref:polyketide synthase dehydratase domain-containing protein n=1 Tax=Streptomyces sp. ACA25 TaxID=3022596 RepID=UPI002307F80F